MPESSTSTLLRSIPSVDHLLSARLFQDIKKEYSEEIGQTYAACRIGRAT